MREVKKIDSNLSIEIIDKYSREYLTDSFFSKLYNVFKSEENNIIAGIGTINDMNTMKRTINFWYDTGSEYMFFLYENDKIVGTTQAFKTVHFGENNLNIGYIISPEDQGKGLGTKMLRFVSEYLTEKGYPLVLGFRDGNYASEKIAAKNNYTYLKRIEVPDSFGNSRPMTYYKYQGKLNLNEEYQLVPGQNIVGDEGLYINDTMFKRVDPSKFNIEEYMYLCNSVYKPDNLKNSYYLAGPIHFKTVEKLKKKKIYADRFGITDSYNLGIKDNADIVSDELMEYISNDLNVHTVVRDIKNKRTTVIFTSDKSDKVLYTWLATTYLFIKSLK